MNRHVLSLAFGSALLTVACSGGSTDDDDTTRPGLCLDVSGSTDVGGLAIRNPESEVAGCRGVDGSSAEVRVCEEKAPDLSCVDMSEPLGTSVDVTFTGCVSSFGLDAQSDGLVVTILEESVAGIATDPGYNYDGTPAMGQGAEKTSSAFLGQVISQSVPAATCIDGGSFAVADIPTERPLIVRVTDQNQDIADRQYVDTYQYNVILRNSAVRDATSMELLTDTSSCSPTTCIVQDDVNTVFETTFTTIALTAGVSNIDGDDDLYDGVGQGHVAGEIQDCTSEDTMKNAVVALSSNVKKLAYFNVDFPPAVANLEDPKVDQTRNRTNADGLYAAIAVDTQDGGEAITIGAAITTDVCGADGECKCNADGTLNEANTVEPTIQQLGTRQIYVYPDSITILTFDRALYTAP
ncbi:MAG: hypothetical protein RIT81_35865 [Deltaproteobacteria bacterium]